MNVRPFAKSGFALIALGAAALLLAACSSDSGDGASSATATPTPSGGSASSAAATPTPSGDASAAPTATPTSAPAPASADPGGRIAFSIFLRESGQSDVYAVNADGSGLENLTDAPSRGSSLFPAWSPDGSRIAFVLQPVADTIIEHISVMDADGSNPANLTDSGSQDFQPAWSPDGSRIAFTSYRDDTTGDIFVMDADGSNPTNLTPGSLGRDTEPAWSSDGDRIAFVSDVGHDAYEIYVMNADGSGRTRLTEAADASIGSLLPAWSPDGNRIAFLLHSGGHYGLAVIDADGSGQAELANPQSGDVGLSADEPPAWSPDGSRIAFTAGVASEGGGVHLFVMSADGSAPPARLAENAHKGVWSPDGSRIAFAAYDTRGDSDIYAIDADGSNRTLLADMEPSFRIDGLAWQPASGG